MLNTFWNGQEHYLQVNGGVFLLFGNANAAKLAVAEYNTLAPKSPYWTLEVYTANGILGFVNVQKESLRMVNGRNGVFWKGDNVVASYDRV